MVDVPEEERGFMVLLEEVRSDVKLIIDYYLQLDQKIDRVAQESLDRDHALEQKMDQGFAAVMQEIRTVAQDLRQEIRGLGRRFDTHEQAHAS